MLDTRRYPIMKGIEGNSVVDMRILYREQIEKESRKGCQDVYEAT